MAEKEEPLTFVEWVIVILASLGFAFDTYELLMLPLVLPPAITAATARLLGGQLRVGICPGRQKCSDECQRG